MSLRTTLQRDFSPYEIALLGGLLGYGLGVAAMVAMAMGRTGIALLLMLAVLLVVTLFVEFSRCPGCGKDPMRWSSQGIYRFLWRLWPERECSECRFPLDEHPPLDGAAK